MGTDKVKVLASTLRKYDQQTARVKRQKTANLVVAATGLELLRRKLEE